MAKKETTKKINLKLGFDKLDKFSGLIILEGQEKLDQAKSAFEKGEYFQTFIYSSEATDLFIEAKTAK